MAPPVHPYGHKSGKGVSVLVRELRAGVSVVNLLGTADVSKPPGSKASSWIVYWQQHSQQAKTVCCAEGCYRTDNIAGGHVKIASNPAAAALLHTRWYVVPACPKHNKRSSCKTYKVKRVIAVEAPPSLSDRVISWKADIAKLARAMVGKR